MTYSNHNHLTRAILVWLLVSCLVGCATPEEKKTEEFEDFGLWKPAEDIDLASEDADSHRQLRGESFSSLPLPIKVGRGVDTFKAIPRKSRKFSSSYLGLQKDRCKLLAKIKSIEIHRYLFTGDWVRMDNPLVGNVPVKLSPGMDFFFQVSAELDLKIPRSFYKICKKMFSGKTAFVGQLTLSQTDVSFQPAPRRSPKVKSMIKFRPPPVKAYCSWSKKNRSPKLVDELGMPLVLTSPIFHGEFKKNGFYYLNIRPWLELKKRGESGPPRRKRNS